MPRGYPEACRLPFAPLHAAIVRRLGYDPDHTNETGWAASVGVRPHRGRDERPVSLREVLEGPLYRQYYRCRRRGWCDPGTADRLAIIGAALHPAAIWGPAWLCLPDEAIRERRHPQPRSIEIPPAVAA